MNVEVNIQTNSRAGEAQALVEFYKSANCGNGKVSGSPFKKMDVILGQAGTIKLPPGGFCMKISANGYADYISNVFELFPTELASDQTWQIGVILDQANSQTKTLNVAGRVFLFGHNPAGLKEIRVVLELDDGSSQFVDSAYLPMIISAGHYSLAGLPIAVGNKKVKAYRLEMDFDAASRLPRLTRRVRLGTTQAYKGMIVQDFWVYPQQKVVCVADDFESGEGGWEPMDMQNSDQSDAMWDLITVEDIGDPNTALAQGCLELGQ
jgi:hypothetical protein